MIYRLLFRLVLQRFDAESVHALACRSLRCLATTKATRALLRRLLGPHESLRVRALGLDMPSPLGLAAGFDKDGRSFESLGALGFGFIEVGTVTSLPQAGNGRPRVVRLPRRRALLNWMGFPNPGAAALADRLRNRSGTTIVGVNVGKTKSISVEHVLADYWASVAPLAEVADYLVINVSSPNTPGLRDFQAIDRLTTLLADTQARLRRLGCLVPILVKIGPDLPDEQIDAIADLAQELRIDGIVAVNTSADSRLLGARTGSDIRSSFEGGISGSPLKHRSLEILRRLYARVDDRVVLISVGGVSTPEEAWERILAGATLVQAYTGFVYGGPLWPRRMNQGLTRLLRESSAASIEQAVGLSVRSSVRAAMQSPAVSPAGATRFT